MGHKNVCTRYVSVKTRCQMISCNGEQYYVYFNIDIFSMRADNINNNELKTIMVRSKFIPYLVPCLLLHNLLDMASR